MGKWESRGRWHLYTEEVAEFWVVHGARILTVHKKARGVYRLYPPSGQYTANTKLTTYPTLEAAKLAAELLYI